MTREVTEVEQQIRRLIKQKKIRPYTLAREAKIGLQSAQRFCSGDGVSLLTLQKIAKVLKHKIVVVPETKKRGA